MATTTPIPALNSPRELFQPAAPSLYERLQHESEAGIAGQNRSSSLSDIEDGPDNDLVLSEPDPLADDADSNDTEAETERLEESPQKTREKQNVVLTAVNAAHGLIPGPPAAYKSDHARKPLRPVSDAAPTRDSSLENNSVLSKSKSPRKRKRSDHEGDEMDIQQSLKRLGSDSSISDHHSASEDCTKPQQSVQARDPASRSDFGDVEGEESEEDDRSGHGPVALKSKPDKRRSRPSRDGVILLRRPSESSVNGVPGQIDTIEAEDSNAEDGDGDDVGVGDQGESAGNENAVKDEEIVVKRKSAMDSLTAIEKCFASLRDKLYDERLAKCDAELAMLEGADIKHPELLSMKEVLEQRRDEKIQYENTLLKYKLGSLQNKSVAEKAQVHCQYMQTVREIRDQNLEQVNKEWYQIHKERRSREDDVPEFMYFFPTRRSHQISNQTAYNKEVSLLSGLAKHRGFPAAPEIRGAKPSEIDSDMEKLGIVQQPAMPLARHPPSLRASISANAVLTRPRAVADEHFLEQNPWANPQHPAHLHSQASALSRTVSPLAAPVTQRRTTEPYESFKQAPTLAGAQQGYLKSLPSAPPSVAQPDKDPNPTKSGFNPANGLDPHSSIPNRPALSATEKSVSVPASRQGGMQKNNDPAVASPENGLASISGRNQAPEMHMKPYIPKSLRRTGSPKSAATPKFLASPPGRFAAVKAEDMSRLSGRPPTPQHYHRPVPVNGASNGACDR